MKGSDICYDSLEVIGSWDPMICKLHSLLSYMGEEEEVMQDHMQTSNPLPSQIFHLLTLS